LTRYTGKNVEPVVVGSRKSIDEKDIQLDVKESNIKQPPVVGKQPPVVE